MNQAALSPLNLDFLSVNILMDEDNDYDYSEYEISVSYRNKTYTIFKKINLFISLYDTLESHFPGIQMPPVPDVFNGDDIERQEMKQDGMYAEDYIDSLTKLMQFYCHHPVIREAVFFKKFMEIDKNFPDEFKKVRTKKVTSKMPVSRATLQLAQSISSNDLMPDGYWHNPLSPKGPSRTAMSVMRQPSNDPPFNSPSHGDDFDTDDEEACVIGEKDLSDYFPN